MVGQSPAVLASNRYQGLDTTECTHRAQPGRTALISRATSTNCDWTNIRLNERVLLSHSGRHLDHTITITISHRSLALRWTECRFAWSTRQPPHRAALWRSATRDHCGVEVSGDDTALRSDWCFKRTVCVCCLREVGAGFGLLALELKHWSE
jgi:hypothetical protein